MNLCFRSRPATCIPMTGAQMTVKGKGSLELPLGHAAQQPVEKVAATHNASKNFCQAEPQLTDSTLLEN